MAFQPTEDVVSAELRYTWQGQLVENRLHYFKTGFVTADMGLLAQALYELWANSLSTVVSSEVLLREVYVTDLRTADGPVATYAPGTLVGGSNVNESVTNNTSIVISLRTAQRGRSRRGRIYHVGLTENMIADNRISTAARDSILAGWADFRETAATAGWTLVVLSRVVDGVPRPVASSATVTQMLITDDVVDSQRRRLPGRGQ